MRIKRIIFGFVCMLWGVLLIHPTVVKAEISTDEAFEGAVWKKLFEGERTGVVQSICVTDQYIVTMDNTTDKAKDADIIRAYYRNNTDQDGNAVEQYSLAKTVSDRCYEHANGMAYNPKTNEIAVALYTNVIKENRGCIYIIDADTLEYKTSVKISDDYNILGIGYDEEKDQYVIQTNEDGGYSFKILDSSFQIVEDLGECAGTSVGSNFQDLCVSGDYIINFPRTWGMGIGDYINVYSISRKTLVSSSLLDFPFENVRYDEPESICELEPGLFLAAVNVGYEDGTCAVSYYETMVPYNFPAVKQLKTAETDTNSETDITAEPVEESSSGTQADTSKGFMIKGILYIAVLFSILGICRRIIYVRRKRKILARKTRRERERLRHDYQL